MYPSVRAHMKLKLERMKRSTFKLNTWELLFILSIVFDVCTYIQVRLGAWINSGYFRQTGLESRGERSADKKKRMISRSRI